MAAEVGLSISVSPIRQTQSRFVSSQPRVVLEIFDLFISHRSGGFFTMGKTRIRLFMTAILMAVSLLSTVFMLSPVSRAFAASHHFVAGHVYVLNNPTGPNSISAFNRAANGTLTFVGTTAIGGQGSGAPLGSQGSLIRSPDGSRLFAVDAGSNQISVIAVDFQGNLTAVSVSSS